MVNYFLESSDKKFLVATYMNMLYDRGLVTPTGGNVSIKEGEGQFFITPTALFKGGLNADQISLINYEGKLIKGSLPPSSEWRMHAAIYESSPEVKAIVHAHPTYALIMARAGLRFKPITEEALIMFRDGVGFVQKVAPGTWDLANYVAQSLKGKKATLIEDHGAVTVGDTVLEAFAEMDALEQNSKITVLSSMLKGTLA